MSINQTHGSSHLGRREWVQGQLVGGAPGGDCMEEIKPKLGSKDPGAIQTLGLPSWLKYLQKE